MMCYTKERDVLVTAGRNAFDFAFCLFATHETCYTERGLFWSQDNETYTLACLFFQYERALKSDVSFT